MGWDWREIGFFLMTAKYRDGDGVPRMGCRLSNPGGSMFGSDTS